MLPQDRKASDARLPESSVPHWEHGVPESQEILNHAFVRLLEKEWLATLRIDVGVSAEEGIEDPELIPPNKHIRLGVAEESSNIS
jgi:hypothetical protein